MNRFFVAVAIAVVVLNIGIFIYSDYKTRQTIAEFTARATDFENQVSTPYVPTTSELSQGLPQATSTTEYVEIPEEDRTEDYRELKSEEELFEELENLIAVEEECCPDDDTEEYLSWEQKVRNDLTKRHGAIPEIDRYIELATVYRDGGNLTVSEVVEEIELRVMLYGVGHEELADTIEMAKNYPPNAIVKVKRESNDNSSAEAQPAEGTTTSTEYVPADS